MKIEQTLQERGARYGDFAERCKVAQDLQNVMRDADGFHRCSPVQKQALTVFADKISRILTGDPDYPDNWHDIQGYARLAEECLPVVEAISDSVTLPGLPEGFLPFDPNSSLILKSQVCKVILRSGFIFHRDRAQKLSWARLLDDEYKDIVGYLPEQFSCDYCKAYSRG